MPSPPLARSPAAASAGVRALTVALLALATALAFQGVRNNGWILIDDPAYVTENPHVAHGLTADGLHFALTTPHGGNWHPLTTLSHLLDVQFFGLAPGPPHIENLLWHVLAAVLLLLALDRLTGAWWRSTAVAAIFALHPLRVESVAWIAERKDVLSGALFALTLLAYARWCEKPVRARFAQVACALALGLLAKPMLVTTPFVLLLLDAWPLRRLDGSAASWRARIREKAPLFALAAALVGITYAVQHATGAVTAGHELPLGARVSNALVSYARYAGASVWPRHLAVFYPHPRVPQPLAASLCALAVLAAAGAAWRWRARAPWLATGFAWYLGMLVPVIGLVQVGRQGWADRYTYLPTIGLAIALVWTVAEATRASRALRLATAAIGIVACAALGLLSARQVARWRDSVTLFAWTSRVVPGNATGFIGYGNALVKAGRAAEAIPAFESALRIDPDDDTVRDRLAAVLAGLGRFDEAREHLRAALARHERAERWFDLGQLEARAGRHEEASRAYARSLALDPTHAATHARLAASLRALGRTGEALAPLVRAVALEPGNIGMRENLAAALAELRRDAEALAEYDTVLAARPDDAYALVQSAWLLASSGDSRVRDGARAVTRAERARAATHEPEPLIEAALAAAYAEAGRYPDAVATAERASELARLAGSADEAAEYARHLALYRTRRPLRQP